MTEKIYFTRLGMRKYLDDIIKMEDELKKLYERLAYIAEVGGDQYHDNFSYEQQMNEIHMKDDYLSKMKKQLINFEVFDPIGNADYVRIGAKVTIEKDNKEETWEVVGFGESDPENGKIAYNSPLAKSLMGKEEGDEITFKTFNICIINIE